MSSEIINLELQQLKDQLEAEKKRHKEDKEVNLAHFLAHTLLMAGIGILLGKMLAPLVLWVLSGGLSDVTQVMVLLGTIPS
jgi:uncharacterized Tic20 family protein